MKGKYDSSEQRDEFNKNTAGLLGGADIAHERIKSGVSEDAAIKKSLLQKRFNNNQNKRTSFLDGGPPPHHALDLCNGPI